MLFHAHQIVVRPSWNGGVHDDVQRTWCRLLFGPPALPERFEVFAACQVVAVQPALLLRPVVVQEPNRGACESEYTCDREDRGSHVGGKLAEEYQHQLGQFSGSLGTKYVARGCDGRCRV